MANIRDLYDGKRNVITQGAIPRTIDRAFKAHLLGSKSVLVLDSFPGMWKSGGVAYWNNSQTQAREFYDIRLGNLLPSDVRIPTADLTEDVCKTLLTNRLPFHRPKDGHYTVFCDEIFNMPVPMQKVFLQIALDREIDGKKLPTDTFIVGAGNGMLTRSHGERFGMAQVDRLNRQFVIPDNGEFCNHLRSTGKMPEMEAFISLNPSLPYGFNPKEWDGESGLATFRSLFEIGLLINTYKDASGRFIENPNDDPAFVGMVAGKVGDSVADALQAFLVIFATVGSIDHVIDNPDTFEVPDSPTTKWVIATKLVGAASSTNFALVIRAARRLAPGSPGWVEMFVGRSATNSKPGLRSTPEAIAWLGSAPVIDAACNRN